MQSAAPLNEIAAQTRRPGVNGQKDIPELTELDSGRAIVRIPVEQNVPLTPRVRAIIDTPQFQRLAEISQLGLVAKVYPGARHTRFEHALGVYHNALLYLRQLQNDERFLAQVDRPTCELLIVAALLHDLGHWPFCHPIEDLGLEGLPSHEAFANSFLTDDSELACVLQNRWSIQPADVVEVLAGRKDSPRLRLLRSILSGPIDIDKLDYLERDSLHCGVPYGRHFDKQRLIQSLVLNETGDGLAMTSKGKTAAELMVHSRYVMFSEVYWHHAVRSATSLFARAFYELRNQIDLPTLFHETDAGMIARLREVAIGHPAEQCLEAVFGRKRRLYKRAVELSHLNDAEVYERLSQRPYSELVTIANRIAARLSNQLGRTVEPTQVLVDGPPPHREVEFAVDVFFPKEHRYRPLRSVSPMIDALARTSFDEYVKRVRVFVAPELIEPIRSAKIADAWWRSAMLDQA
jgi:HD superfamily phosphohydrolase